MKRLASILLLIAVSAAAWAWTPRISYGLEWGYTGSPLKTHQYSYIYSAGSRITDNGAQWRYFSNGSLLAGAGLDVSSKVNLSLYSGLVGVYSERWMVPLELRARWCPKGLTAGGPIAHAGAAAMFPTSSLLETAGRINVGGGWRCMVYKHISIDLLLSLNATLDHDILYDPDTRVPIMSSDIMRNYSEYWGVNFSLAINF